MTNMLFGKDHTCTWLIPSLCFYKRAGNLCFMFIFLQWYVEFRFCK